MQHYVAQKFFHATPHTFSNPDYQLIQANRSNHENGLLGLWVANQSDWIAGFGSHLYEMEISGSVKDITVTELRSLGKDSDTFIAMRSQLLAEGCDVLRLVEIDGRSAMSIVINFKAIENFSLCNQTLTSKPSSALRYR